MFEGCTIKYVELDGVKTCINIIYPANADGIVKKISAPIHSENRHYQEIQEWVAEGNTIEEAD